MAYIIHRYSGTELTVLEDATVDTSTSISLVGKNYVGYGEIQNENFLYLLENFANDNPPGRPLSGQLWYNTSNNKLYSYTGTEWAVVSGAAPDDEPPTNPTVGSLWLDTTVDTVYCWNGEEWLTIGPESAKGFGESRILTTTLLSTEDQLFPVIKVVLDDIVMAMITASPFTIDSSNAVPGFNTLGQGITLSSLGNITGNLKGLADRASILENTRLINNIAFDGSQDITLKASTTNKLLVGNYIVGSNFDGSTERTWSVDASSASGPNKVVARDPAGNFSANTVYSNLVGNVSGDVTSTGTSNFGIVVANEFIGDSLSGNAFSATKLQNDRYINGVMFNGTADITIPAAANTLTTDTLSSNVVNSSLELLGTLRQADVADTGVRIGSLGQFQLKVESTTSTISVENELGLNIQLKDSARTDDVTSIKYMPSAINFAESGHYYPAIVPNEDEILEIGQADKKIKQIYTANVTGDLIGNADTATFSTTTRNIEGGGLGNIPYQTAENETSFVPVAANKILRSNGSAVPYWGDATFANLIAGDHISTDTAQPYTGLLETTINVDANSGNIADTLVVRDSSGNFSAGTITASLSGNATSASQLSTARTINGVAFNGTANITVYDSSKAPVNSPTLTGAPKSTTPPTSDNSTRIATTAFVRNYLGQSAIWAGETTLTNIISTYSNYGTGTKVSFWEVRTQRRSSGNGGTYTFYDRYRRTVQKQSNGTWIEVG